MHESEQDGHDLERHSQAPQRPGEPTPGKPAERRGRGAGRPPAGAGPADRLCVPRAGRRAAADQRVPLSGVAPGPDGRWAAGLRIHDLRHTAVALWIAAGASPKEVAARAGHTSVSSVLDRYGHLFPESDAALRDGLDVLFRGATEQRRDTAG
jgi:integrase